MSGRSFLIFGDIEGKLDCRWKRADAEQKIAAAEAALKRADATLAQKLGFQLCHCTYPPQIMLWHKHEKVTKCPRAECGRRIKDFHRPLPHSDVSY